jgi:hypothetical protein
MASSSGWFDRFLLPAVSDGGAEISFGAWRAPGLVAASRLLRSFVGFQTARRMEELAGTWSVALEALRLNGSLRVRTCQQAIRILRATAALAGFDLPWRCLVSL